MPKPALSLLGFLEKEQAFEYLQKYCLLDDSSPQALQQHFSDATSRLGSVIENAGNPETLNIPAIHQQHVDIIRNGSFAKGLESRGRVEIQLVEIAPLLAAQIHVELDRAESFYQRCETAPDIENMLLRCLPFGNDTFPIGIAQPLSPSSWMVRTPSLNLRSLEGGLFGVNGDNYLGVKIGAANPLVQVLKFKGRAYLVNGFHRAFSFGRAGAKYMPCIMQEVQSLDGIALGIPLERLLLDNPPTLAHFLNDRAYPIQLRHYQKYMTVTYAEHLFFEE